MDKKGFILSSRLEQRATSQAVSYAVVKKKRKTSIELIVDLEGEANKQRKNRLHLGILVQTQIKIHETVARLKWI